ncbi:uncharacterized protein LOC132203835 isoform X2 [Neocloeon triangulifer]|uniref:uncharacterized protein LOC132203835 isoform X2 n=1 Tax=Neocloeon triangulifer TaxID=2078957 RepID=UPI00286F33B0|nr:uncharacterized protein LOC132203835 isoform X2 [Neocloeon triangulifer]
MAFNANFAWIKPSVFTYEVSAPESLNGRLQDLFNSSLPFYLPAAYHRVQTQPDCYKQFLHAAQFILHNEVHGVAFWKMIDALCRKTRPEIPISSEFLSVRTLFEEFANNLDECKNAAEYLFEPRVIMQLPYFPSVLYQWMSAFTAEWFRISKKLSFLGLFAYPASLKTPLTELNKFYHSAEAFIAGGFALLGLGVKSYPQIDHKLVQFIKVHFVPRIGHFQEFFSKCDSLDIVLLSVQRQILMKFGKESMVSIRVKKDHLTNLESLRLPFRINIGRSLSLMHAIQDDGVFGHRITDLSEIDRVLTSADSTLDLICVDDDPMMFIAIASTCTVNWNREVYVSFLEQHIIENRLINGFSQQDLKRGPEIKCIVDNIENYFFYEFCLKDNELCTDNGHTNKLKGINAEFNFPDKASASSNLLYLLKCIKIIKEATSKPRLDIDRVVESLRKETAMSKKFQARNNYFDRKAAAMQERISRMVTAILTQNCKTKGFRFESQKNLLWAQYMLPCFVSSFLTANKKPYFKAFNLDRLVTVIENLIKQFEDDLNEPFKEKAFPEKKFIRSFYAEKIFYLWHNLWYEINLFVFDKTSPDHKLEGIPGIQSLEKIFTDCFYNLPDIHECFDDIIRKWTVRQQWFLMRISKSIRVLELRNAPSPNLKYLLKMHNFLDQVLCILDYVPSTIRWLLQHVHRKIHCLKRKQSIPKDGRGLADLRKKVFSEADNLSFRKIFGIVLHTLFIHKSAHYDDCEAFIDVETKRLVDLFKEHNWLGLRLNLMPKLCADKRRDLSLLDKNDLERNPEITLCLTRKISNGRIVMTNKGEITMAPVKHCRWCGKIELFSDNLKFILCSYCKDFDDYPDVTWYCSKDCEETCNRLIHQDEHDDFILSCLHFEPKININK